MRTKFKIWLTRHRGRRTRERATRFWENPSGSLPFSLSKKKVGREANCTGEQPDGTQMLFGNFCARRAVHIREEVTGLAVVLLYRNVRILSALTGIASISVSPLRTYGVETRSSLLPRAWLPSRSILVSPTSHPISIFPIQLFISFLIYYWQFGD